MAASELCLRISISYGLRSPDQIMKFAIYLFRGNLLYSLFFYQIKWCYAKIACAMIDTVNYHRNHMRSSLYVSYITMRHSLESLLLEDE